LIKFIFDTKPDAFTIQGIALACVKDLGRISVEVLNGICLVVSNDDDSERGWTDISKAKIVREGDGYVLHLPDPIPIKTLKLDSFVFNKWFSDYRHKTNL